MRELEQHTALLYSAEVVTWLGGVSGPSSNDDTRHAAVGYALSTPTMGSILGWVRISWVNLQESLQFESDNGHKPKWKAAGKLGADFLWNRAIGKISEYLYDWRKTCQN